MIVEKQGHKLLQDCEGLLFDKDGTLVDFHYLWLSWTQRVSSYLVQRVDNLTPEEVQQQWGVDAATGKVDAEGPLAVGSVSDLTGSAAGLVYRYHGLWPESRQLVSSAIAEAYNSIDKAEYTKPLNGVVDMVRSLREKGYKLAVVTTDDTASAQSCLQASGMEEYFHVILGCDQVENCKPFADLALTACRMLDVPPQKAAVIGDTRADMLMGKHARVAYRVGVTSGVGSHDDLKQYADFILESAAALID